LAADDVQRPWRSLRDAEGRAARLAEVRRLSAEGLEQAEIAERMGVAKWVAERDLDAISGGETD
jgi:DNA-binding transcriptional regulator LsrR (DeoR family)